MDPSVFSSCQNEFPDENSTEILGCVAESLERISDVSAENLKDFLLVISGAMIFFMQTGFAVLCAGAVRIKNVQNTMLKNLLDACGAAMAFYMLGFGFAYGGQSDDATGTTFIGTSDFFTTGSRSSFWFYQYAFSATSVTIVAGTLAERCQMAAYLWYSVLLAGFIYPVVAHAVWSQTGFLSPYNSEPFLGVGAIDFSGSGVVHVTGGSVALYATLLLGPRRGRFYDAHGEPLENPKPFPGHSMALQLLGTMTLWFGWFAFNSSSALLLPGNSFGTIAANAAVSTALSGAAGGISALFTNLIIEERRTGEPHFDLVMCMNGCLSGLVAVTGGCGVIKPWAAVITGIVAGWLYIFGNALLIRLRIDDAVNAIPVHMINGLWGLVAVGLYASPEKLELAYGIKGHGGWLYDFSSPQLLEAQLCTAVFITGWTFMTMFPFFFFLSYQGWLRTDSLEELVGLDISYHGGVHALGPASGVKTEYITAYNKRKDRLRRHSSRDHGSTVKAESGGPVSEVDDPEFNQEAAALEALRDDDNF